MCARLQNPEAVVVSQNKCFKGVVRPNIRVEKAKDGALGHFATSEIVRQLANGINKFFAAAEVLPPGLQPLLVLASRLAGLFLFLGYQCLYVRENLPFNVAEDGPESLCPEQVHLLKIDHPSLRFAVSQHFSANHERMDDGPV